MEKPRKVPMRRCVATNEQYPKKELIRVVRTPEGEIIIDKVGKANGRGAYLCKKKSAIELARKKRILEKHLETEIPSIIYDQLFHLLGDGIE